MLETAAAYASLNGMPHDVLTAICGVLQPEMLGTSFAAIGALGWGAWYGAGIPCFSLEASTA